MIRFLTHDQIDSERWNDCITQSANGNVYGYSWYLDLVCPGWCALVDGEYECVMPLPAWQKMKIQYLSQPLFTQQLGVFSRSGISSREVREFLYKIPRRFKYVDINLNSANKIETTGLNLKYNINYELNLDEPYPQLANAYSENLKRNLRKAGKFALRISKKVEPGVLIELFRENRGSSIKSLSDKQYEVLKNLFNMLVQKGICEIWGIYDEQDRILGGVSWVISNKKGIFLFSAVSDSGRHQGAMPLLIDTFISENAGKDMILDFEGSNDEKLGRFYAGFGSKKVFYPRIYFNYLPFYIRIGLIIYRDLRVLIKK
jgi:hypothetical protein